MQRQANTEGTLHALERSRSVALEEARALHQGQARVLAEHEAERDASAKEIECAYEAQRQELVRSDRLSVEQFGIARRYAASLILKEHAAQVACEQAEQLLREAQDEMRKRLEDLKAVERLRSRRRSEEHKKSTRARQRRLDELGLIHASNHHRDHTGK